MGQNQWYYFGVGAPPIVEPILVGIEMFTGGTIWILTHGHLSAVYQWYCKVQGVLRVPAKACESFSGSKEGPGKSQLPLFFSARYCSAPLMPPILFDKILFGLLLIWLVLFCSA